METMLLGFCLLSLLITTLIVSVELIQERRAFARNSGLGNLPSEAPASVLTEASSRPAESTPNVHSIYSALEQKLVRLGYHDNSTQLQFLNRTLHTQHAALTDLSMTELQTVVSFLKHRQDTVAVHEPTPQVA
ncbi:MAG: hypothetical protein CL911_02860 [Deltaproteobacteria bacterium]|nr:hypothetical protein [Deltaproteobacteria bacterium]